MSVDAKVWNGKDNWWFGCHDGPCCNGAEFHAQGDLSLVSVLRGIEECLRYSLAWEFRQYPDGAGLVGFRYGGSPTSDK